MIFHLNVRRVRAWWPWRACAHARQPLNLTHFKSQLAESKTLYAGQAHREVCERTLLLWRTQERCGGLFRWHGFFEDKRWCFLPVRHRVPGWTVAFLYLEGTWVCSTCDLNFDYKSKLEQHFESARHKALTAMQPTDPLTMAVARDDVMMEETSYSEEVNFSEVNWGLHVFLMIVVIISTDLKFIVWQWRGHPSYASFPSWFCFSRTGVQQWWVEQWWKGKWRWIRYKVLL